MPRISRPALLLVPLLGFMVLTYLVPFLGIVQWSVTCLLYTSPSPRD